jgi:hypothetical protein
MIAGGASGGGEKRVIDIDLRGLGTTNGAKERAKLMSRSIIAAFVALLTTLCWFLVVLALFDPVIGDGESPGEIVGIFIAFVIAGGPFVFFYYRLVWGKERYDAGIDTLMTESDFTQSQLARAVPHSGVALRTVIERVQAFAKSLGSPAIVRETDPDKRRKSRNLRLRIPGMMIVGLVLGIATGSAWGYFPLGVAVVTGPLVFLQSRKLLQPSASALLAQDKRRMILLLRSFKDDETKSWQRIRSPIGNLVSGRRFEQGIAGPLGAFGPVIAIGRPGEELPQIGAARNYLGDAEWQPSVLRWMDEALLLVMIAGDTEWIRWELDRILEKNRSSHLFIILPPVKDTGRWRNVLAVLGKTQWGTALQTLDTRGLMVVQLRPGGDVIAIRGASSPFIEDYHLATSIAIHEEFCVPAA